MIFFLLDRNVIFDIFWLKSYKIPVGRYIIFFRCIEDLLYDIYGMVAINRDEFSFRNVDAGDRINYTEGE